MSHVLDRSLPVDLQFGALTLPQLPPKPLPRIRQYFQLICLLSRHRISCLSSSSQPIGTTVCLSEFNLTASDPDAGDTWSFESGYLWFTVSGDCLVVNHQYDRETETYQTTFDVYVRDAAGLQDTATVTLTYNDINDNTPVFGQSYYEASVLGKVYKSWLYVCLLYVLSIKKNKLQRLQGNSSSN